MNPVKEKEKLESGSVDVVIFDSSKIALLRCKYKKMVTVTLSKYGLNPTGKTKRYIKKKKGWVDVEQTQCIKKYNKGTSGVDCLDRNIATYMIAHRSKK